MAIGGVEALDRHYSAFEGNWKVADCSADYGRLVVPHGNSEEPLYRWFHLKEAFSSRLLDRLLSDVGLSAQADLSIADPFAGSGTTLLSGISACEASGYRANVFGVERNPFIWELAQAKLRARIFGRSISDAFVAEFEKVKKFYEDLKFDNFAIPGLSTLRNEKYFPSDHMQDLLRIRHAIDAGATELTRSLFRVCLASCVESSSRLRRDGRALRYEPSRDPRLPWEFFLQRVELIRKDLECTHPASSGGEVVLGDARQVSSLATGRDFDLILFSPPYPNNIDYTEIYKTEAWVLGCYESEAEMKAQRQRTVRSHPSVRFSQAFSYMKSGLASDVQTLIDPIVSSVPIGDRYHEGRKEVITGYADDMLRVLIESRRVIRPNGRLVFVVGNSLHGSGDSKYVIAADVIMGRLAELCGWRVSEVKVARMLKRRTGESVFLRESLVILEPV
jgi:SAM-dependent methyltransferase